MAATQRPAKRGRGSSAAMDDAWRDLGREATRQLLLVGDGTTREPLALADAARRKLAARADKALLFLIGATPMSASGTPTEWPDGVCPTVDLENARREIARLGAMHRAAGRLFALYGGAHPGGGGGDDPRWRIWEERRAVAASHFDAAVRRLLSAASQVVVGGETIRIVSTGPFPRMSPRWPAYAPAEEEIARRAADEAAQALDEVRRVRDAVFLEFFDAWAVLSR